MHVRFTYDPEKEAKPITVGLKGQYDPTTTDLASAALRAEVDVSDPSSVRAFALAKIAADGIDIDACLAAIAGVWYSVEVEVEARLVRLFECDFDPGIITAYLTIGNRCPYDFQSRFFFIPAATRSPIRICLHELMHFYTHELIEPLFLRAGVVGKHGAFKEALTVLINDEFADLIETPDNGYAQHAQLRQWIREAWASKQSIEDMAYAYSALETKSLGDAPREHHL